MVIRRFSSRFRETVHFNTSFIFNKNWFNSFTLLRLITFYAKILQSQHHLS